MALLFFTASENPKDLQQRMHSSLRGWRPEPTCFLLHLKSVRLFVQDAYLPGVGKQADV